jgi:hypothetical protein
MSTVIYGAGQVLEVKQSAMRDVRDYWLQLASLHQVVLHLGRPDDSYLEPEVAALWAGAGWLRFQLSADPTHTEANGALVHATQRAGRVLARGAPGVTVANVWTRVPLWRILDFMFWHEMISDAYLVVEDTSGDVADCAAMRTAALSDVLGEIWWNYGYNSSEDPAIYRIDLSCLPR